MGFVLPIVVLSADIRQSPISPEMVVFYITQDTQKHPLLPELKTGLLLTHLLCTHCLVTFDFNLNLWSNLSIINWNLCSLQHLLETAWYGNPAAMHFDVLLIQFSKFLEFGSYDNDMILELIRCMVKKLALRWQEKCQHNVLWWNLSLES